MKIVVTGATGFVGKPVVSELLERGHEIVTVGRDLERFAKCDWAGDVKFVSADLQRSTADPRALLGAADLVAHLAWPGLPNFKSMTHIETTLPAAYRFLKSLVATGCPRLFVVGTCFEYGLSSGPLSENLPADPVTAYGLAKDSLRRYLECLRLTTDFQLQWARLFYLHGDGQNEASLIPQLDAAIDRRDPVFNMSGGEQLRDFLPVEVAATMMCDIIESPSFCGIVNVCRGKPISVRSLVEQRILERNAKIELNLGHYPYPDYEPFAFWGDNRKLQSLTRGVGGPCATNSDLDSATSNRV